MVAATQDQKPKNALTLLSSHLEKLKQQIGLVLPKHMTPDRMARLALTAFSTEPKLHDCSFESVAAGVMTASQMGLEIGVGGQGWLIPYGKTATFVPGWMGLVELLNRSGRASAWTGAVYDGDRIDWELGDSPYLKHKPCGEKETLTHVYAIGRIKGSDWPVIEVWNVRAVTKHRDRYNKVGQKHYSFKDTNNFEMYARKVALLQVLKYLPKSIELQAAIDASNAADSGEAYTVDADFVVTVPQTPQNQSEADGLVEELSAKQISNAQAESLRSEQGVPKEPVPTESTSEVGNSTESQSDGAPIETDVVADFRDQVAQCESEEDLEIVRLSIRQSKKLGADEKKILERAVASRAAKFG